MIHIIWDIFLIVFYYFLFALFHSILTSKKIKTLVIKKVGKLIAFYRLGYNILSILFLLLILKIAPRPDVIIYDFNNPFDFLVLIPQLLGLVGLLWSFNYICVKEFIGLSQIKRWMNNQYDVTDVDEKSTLNIEGPYKYVRHPIYFFSILILTSRPIMDLFYLTSLICFIIYFYVGSFYEEKKLVIDFGEAYRKYQTVVPRILPLKIFRH